MSTPNAIEEIFLAQQFDDQKVRDLIKKANIRTSVLNGGKMPREVDMSGAHQGIIALLYIDRLIIPFEDFSSKIKIDNDTSVVVLGELSDPQNVGAVI
jgi:tRNA G18 (ribose-2'-O)-methylase SpoU